LKNFLKIHKIKNLLTLSVKIDGALEGIVCFDNIMEEDYWIEENLELLSIISDILKNVILRKIAEENLRLKRSMYKR